MAQGAVGPPWSGPQELGSPVLQGGMLGVERLVAWPSERERFEQRPSPAFLGHRLQEVVAAQVSLRLLWKQVPQKALPG